jgi:hypothetical protein
MKRFGPLDLDTYTRSVVEETTAYEITLAVLQANRTGTALFRFHKKQL